MLSDVLFREVSPVKTPTGIMALAPFLRPKPSSYVNLQGMKMRGGNESFCVLLEAIQDRWKRRLHTAFRRRRGREDIYFPMVARMLVTEDAARRDGRALFLAYSRTIQSGGSGAGVQRQSNCYHPESKKQSLPDRLTGPIAFVFGNEGVGLSDAVLQVITDEISIPMPGGTESLNAAAAAAVCFFERVRQMETADEIFSVRFPGFLYLGHPYGCAILCGFNCFLPA